MSTEEDIRKASAKFYAGLNSTLNGDSTPMADVGNTIQTFPQCILLMR